MARTRRSQLWEEHGIPLGANVRDELRKKTLRLPSVIEELVLKSTEDDSIRELEAVLDLYGFDLPALRNLVESLKSGDFQIKENVDDDNDLSMEEWDVVKPSEGHSGSEKSTKYVYSLDTILCQKVYNTSTRCG